MDNMSVRKKRYQEFSEFETLAKSDMVCTPTENMNNFLKKKYPGFLSKLYLLPHAYDPDKFPKSTFNETRDGFIYGGTLYNGIEDYIRKIINVLNTHPSPHFKWNIYTNTPYPLLENEKVSSVGIFKHNFLPEDQLFGEIRRSAAYLAIYPETDKDLVSTKFFEIIYSCTPVIYIGEEGDVAKFIRKARAGVHILPANIETELPKYLSGNVPFEQGHFDVSQYSFKTVTENFILAIKIFMKGNVQFNSKNW
jgi:hypothetical protein